jgi:hypothetical protein
MQQLFSSEKIFTVTRLVGAFEQFLSISGIVWQGIRSTL